MARPHVAGRWRQDWPAEVWSAEVAGQLAGGHSRPWTVWLDGAPLAYLEVYRVARDLLARHLPVEPHDLGVHLAIGADDDCGRGLGAAVLRAIAVGLLDAEPTCTRVLGDPAEDHRAARRAFAAAGFVPVADIELPHKRAAVVARHRAIGSTTSEGDRDDHV
jgi:lysine N-acyltransferase